MIKIDIKNDRSSESLEIKTKNFDNLRWLDEFKNKFDRLADKKDPPKISIYEVHGGYVSNNTDLKITFHNIISEKLNIKKSEAV